MPLHFRENQYNGINAHLHSFLQRTGGGWEGFHLEHIAHLREAIDLSLPEGYYAVSEKSLQLSFIDLDLVERTVHKTRADIALFGESQSQPISTFTAVATPTAVIPIAQTFIEEEPLDSIIVRHASESGELLPVTRIELLSPANKPGGSHFRQYFEKRQETLQSGINLVELDYLHESRPVSSRIPSYPDKDTKAYPYSIFVSNPHPSLAQGKTSVYGFSVDDLLPTIAIPLDGSDTIALNFQVIYQRTFNTNRYYGTILVDYEQLPVNFDSYTEPDQQRIRERMKLVQAKQ